MIKLPFITSLFLVSSLAMAGTDADTDFDPAPAKAPESLITITDVDDAGVITTKIYTVDSKKYDARIAELAQLSKQDNANEEEKNRAEEDFKDLVEKEIATEENLISTITEAKNANDELETSTVSKNQWFVSGFVSVRVSYAPICVGYGVVPAVPYSCVGYWGGPGFIPGPIPLYPRPFGPIPGPHFGPCPAPFGPGPVIGWHRSVRHW